MPGPTTVCDRGRAWPSRSRTQGEAFGGTKGETEDAEMRRSGLVRLEVFLASAADRTEPVVGDLLERRPGRDAAVGVAHLGVVDEAAGDADPLLRGDGLAHRAEI